MKITNGRLEREVTEFQKLENKIKQYPQIIKDYYYYLEAADKSYSTIKAYICYIVNFMNYVTQNQNDSNFYKNIKSSTINEYFSSLKYKHNANGKSIKVGCEIREARWSALNNFFTYLTNNNLISMNPMDQTFRPSGKRNKEITYLKENEITECLNNVRNNSDDRFQSRDLCIIAMGISLGLRVSAISQINIEDIDMDRNIIKVVEKGNKYRVMKFGNNLKTIISQYIADREKYYGDLGIQAFFVSRNKKRLCVSSIENVVKKYTGIFDKKITPHKLRATCATNLYKKTGDIYMVANQLGHANIATSKIYTEIDDSMKKKAANLLDELI